MLQSVLILRGNGSVLIYLSYDLGVVWLTHCLGTEMDTPFGAGFDCKNVPKSNQ